MGSRMGEPVIEQLVVSAFSVPTDAPEADGTLEWHETVLVTVEVTSASVVGFGYTYANLATAGLIDELLAREVLGRSAWAVPAAHAALRRAVRNLGQPGIS